MGIMKEMAKIVDEQNKKDKNYIKMSDDFERSQAFKTACDLIFKGKEQPSGYTEPLLHLNRLKKKINQN
jgi:malate synthase